MTSVAEGPHREALGLLGRQADHRDAEQALLAARWIPCGAGDWAIALRSPDGTVAGRISPFDPTGPYSAALYREAAHTRRVPELFVDVLRRVHERAWRELPWCGPLDSNPANVMRVADLFYADGHTRAPVS